MKIEVPETLIKKLQDGDTEARDEIAKRFMPLMKIIIGSWARRFPYKADDISGVAWLGLLTSLETAAEKKIEHQWFVGHCKRSVEGRIKNYLKDDHVVRVPRYAQDAARKADTNYSLPSCLSMSDPDWVDLPSPTTSDHGLFEFYEWCFERMSLSPFERTVLNHAKLGYNNTDIAAFMRVSHTLINRTKTELERRFNIMRHNPVLKARFFGE